MASVTNTAVELAGGDPFTFNLTVGAGSGRVAVVAHTQDSTRTYGAVTFNGAAMTEVTGASIIHSSTQPIQYVWYYDIPAALAAGDYEVSIDLSSAVGDDTAYAWQLTGVVTGGPEDSDEVEGANGGAATQTRTLTCSDGAVVLAVALNNDPTITFTWSGDSGITGRTASDETNFTSAVADCIVSGSGAKVVNAVHSGTAGRKLLSVLSFAPVVGPTIDTQPTAQTARLHGEPTTAATFTVAATTSGGALVYDWELETSVGGGVFANVADGSGATWTGQTAASSVGTFTATTLTGRTVRCNVTDDNGTTTTNAVALTVLNGPVTTASSSSTNASGVGTLTYTSDDALTTNGECLLWTVTSRGQSFYIVTRPA